jgi:hypothetical protein
MGPRFREDDLGRGLPDNGLFWESRSRKRGKERRGLSQPQYTER